MRRKITTALFFLLVLAVFGPAVAGFWVRSKIEHCLKTQIAGTYVPRWFRPSFTLRNVRFEWKQKVEFVSGDLRVDYRPWSLISGGPLRVRLSSGKLGVRLKGEWARLEGVEDLSLDRFEADLGFGREGIREIYGVEALSPRFQFHIKNSEK